MELTLLLPVLASLHVFSGVVSPRDAPPAPSLSLNPRHEAYHAGDTVGLVCSAPPSVDGVQGFQYFGDRIAMLALASSQSNHTYNLTISGPSGFGSYTCSYWVCLSGRNVPARRSEPVLIRRRSSWSRELAVGGSFFTLNSLIFLVTYVLMQREAPGRGSEVTLTPRGRAPPSDPHTLQSAAQSPMESVGESVTPAGSEKNHRPEIEA